MYVQNAVFLTQTSGYRCIAEQAELVRPCTIVYSQFRENIAHMAFAASFLALLEFTTVLPSFKQSPPVIYAKILGWEPLI
jgi:hypothetical protein